MPSSSQTLRPKGTWKILRPKGDLEDPTPKRDLDVEADEVLLVASDASFADDTETRKSTQGYQMGLFNGPIKWQSSKQKTVTTLTTDAELKGVDYPLFANIKFNLEHLPSILCDNQQTVGLIYKEQPQLI